MLPSGYIPCVGIVPAYYGYINTGIVTKSTYTIDALFSGLQIGIYLFGARNTNSNSSAGQINYYADGTGQSYIGYANQRLSLGSDGEFGRNMQHIHFDGNAIEAICGGRMAKLTGATTTFTGTQPMYILALNSAGSYVNGGGSGCFHGMKIYENGSLIAHFVPAYDEANDKYGAYELVNNTFINLSSTYASTYYNRTLYRVDVNHTQGGNAYVKLLNGELVTSVFGADHDAGSGYDMCQLVAVSDPGYCFKNWTDSGGTIISTDEKYTLATTANITVTANFIKKTDIKAWLGYKCFSIKNVTASETPSYRDDIYADVISASVKVDGMQTSATTITVKSVPSAYSSGRPIFIMNPMGKCVYQGVIQNIEDNKITCREPLNVFDVEFLMTTSDSYLDNPLLSGVGSLMSYARQGNSTNTYVTNENVLQDRKFNRISIIQNNLMPLDNDKIAHYTMPSLDSNTVANVESYIMDLFNDFGVYVSSSLGVNSVYQAHDLQLRPSYYKELDSIKISDNVENISNVSIEMEDVETTVLVVFNKEGTTLRGYIGMKNDGSTMSFTYETADTELQNLIGYDNYKVKVVMTSDDMDSVIAQNLTNAKYNHKISFDLSLDNSLFDVDSFQIGQPVEFYYENKMYESIVTSVSYDIKENDDQIHSMKVVLGKVRSSLTSKLNLGRA